MHCQGCNTDIAVCTNTRVVDSKLVETCNVCSRNYKIPGLPDVFFQRPYFDQNLGDERHPDGQYIESKQHKARIMREQGAVEAGDRKHGARVKYEKGYGMRNFL